MSNYSPDLLRLPTSGYIHQTTDAAALDALRQANRAGVYWILMRRPSSV
jgi:hypothetical protein